MDLSIRRVLLHTFADKPMYAISIQYPILNWVPWVLVGVCVNRTVPVTRDIAKGLSA